MQNRSPSSLALLTDLYQLTMAYGYWKSGTVNKEAAFHLTFRKNPFAGGFTIACGLQNAIDYLKDFHFEEGDLVYLSSITGQDGKPLFDKGFLDYLRQLEFTCNVDAIPEGTVVFPHEPLLRVEGPLLQAQIFETALLNFINFQSLIATKAARMMIATGGDAVIEFGLRRAQGIDGALSASRAAYIGGCAATSNVLAGRLFGIPVKGTHAHSWVMSFETELESFQEYAKAMPNNCVFLVDTYDTLEGVRNAVTVGKWLREQGHELVGIRLDSGDLAYLSIEARKILDAGGFPKATIVASNDLDENIISSLKQQGATIGLWGIGTKLVTAFDQPALGGVYKLGAIRGAGENWQYKIKVSEQTVKVSTPGFQQVRRFRDGDGFMADAIYDCSKDEPSEWTIVDPLDPIRQKTIPVGASSEDLLVPIFRSGKLVYQSPSIQQMQQRAQDQLGRFHGSIKRFINPHQYPVGLEIGLEKLKMDLIAKARRAKAVIDLDGR